MREISDLQRYTPFIKGDKSKYQYYCIDIKVEYNSNLEKIQTSCFLKEICQNIFALRGIYSCTLILELKYKHRN